jgi:hypothetical protein
MTDGDGRFSFGSLAAGTYTVSAAKTGFAPSLLAGPGSKRSVAVLVRDGAEVRDVVVTLARGAVLAGRVADDLGEPVNNITVFIEQLVENGGARSTRDRRTVQTNDLGEYRLGSLAEGVYVVSRLAPQPPQIIQSGGRTIAVSPPIAARLGPQDGPPRLFFPNAATLADAEPITLKAGEERRSVDVPGPRPQPALTDLARAADPTVWLVDPNARATGAIRGRVLGPAGPLVEAEVRIAGDTIRAMPPVFTDTLGQYEFADLPAGTYTVSARKNRYLPREFGQEGAAARGTRLMLAVDERRDRVDIRLPMTSAITGQLTDEYGDAVEGVSVRLHQIRFMAGGRRLVEASGASSSRTDDQGRFRISGLQPGAFVVAAYAGQLVFGQPDIPDIPGYATTYFPGTPNASELRLVPVAASQDVDGLNFSLSRIPTAAISGVAQTSSGEPITGGLVLGSSRRAGGIAMSPVGARIQPDGSFTFPNVPPGRYVIQAYRGRLRPPAEGEFAALPVTVSGSDVGGLFVTTSPGSKVSGRVTFDGGQPPTSRAVDISTVAADPDSAPFDGNFARADIHADWTFEMNGISGVRRLRLLRAPRGWGLKRILVGGVDATDTPLTFGTEDDSLTDVEVVLTDRITEIDGSVSDDRNRPVADARVLAFSADSDLWYDRSRFVKMVSTSADGSFSIADLPPGVYFVAAVDRRRANEDNGEWLNPELLDSLTPAAIRITLAEGQHATAAPTLASR